MSHRDDLSPAAANRRRLIKQAFSVGAVSAGAMATGLPGLAQAASLPIGNFRIDVHCHHIPDFYRTSLLAHGILTAGGIPLPSWSPSAAVNFMDRFGIQTQVVSISEPGVTYLPSAAERLNMARQINDYTRDTLINTSDANLQNRFGGFAVMPLGDIGNPLDVFNASAEAVRAITRLQLDGIGLFSSYDGVYLGDLRLEPLMATLNALGAMVFIHPTTPKAMPSLGLPSFLFEFPFETTRAAVNLLYKGVFSRYPRIRWLLAHAGGAIPFLSYRTGLLKLDFDPTNSLYKDLYYDTALSAAPPAMAAVRQITEVNHVMFATDWPFTNLLYLPKPAGDPAPELNLSYNSDERLMVDRRNALAQFPTLAARLGVTL